MYVFSVIVCLARGVGGTTPVGDIFKFKKKSFMDFYRFLRDFTHKLKMIHHCSRGTFDIYEGYFSPTPSEFLFCSKFMIPKVLHKFSHNKML